MPSFRYIKLERLVRGKKQHIDPYKLSEHIAKLERGESLPPICVIKNKNGTFRVNDGHHRFVASLVVGEEGIQCVIY